LPTPKKGKPIEKLTCKTCGTDCNGKDPVCMGDRTYRWSAKPRTAETSRKTKPSLHPVKDKRKSNPKVKRGPQSQSVKEYLWVNGQYVNLDDEVKASLHPVKKPSRAKPTPQSVKAKSGPLIPFCQSRAHRAICQHSHSRSAHG